MANICVCTYDFGPSIEGPGRWVYDLSVTLTKLHNVTVLILGGNWEEEKGNIEMLCRDFDNIKVKHLSESNIKDEVFPKEVPLSTSYRVYKVLENSNYDAIFFFDSGASGFHTIQAKKVLGQFLKSKIITKVVGSNKWYREKHQMWNDATILSLRLNYMEQYSCENSDVVIMPNEEMLNWCIKNNYRIKGEVVYEPYIADVLVENLSNIEEDKQLSRYVDKNMPKVSVCMAYYNHARYLPAALESLEKNTYPNFEVIVVNDGSTDPESIKVFNEMKQKYENRNFIFISKENEYLGKTRNVAESHSTGEYIIFMDSDNIAHSDMIEVMVSAMEFSNADCLTCHNNMFHGTGMPKQSANKEIFIPVGPALDVGIFENCLGDANFIVKRKVFDEIGGFTTDRLSYEDWQFLVKLNLKGYNQDVIPKALYDYRVTSTSMVHTGNMYKSHKRVLDTYNEILPTQLKGFFSEYAFSAWINSINNPVQISSKSNIDNIINDLFPIGSKRRAFAKKVFKILISMKNKIGKLKIKALLISLRTYGLIGTIYKVRASLKTRRMIKLIAKKQKELTAPSVSNKLKISIIVPLYNTPKQFLMEMINSLINQTYHNWELCLADGSDAEHLYVEQVVRDFSRKDSRICYKKLSKNFGISMNTNFCLEMATGDYIGLLDHDDLLAPTALSEVMALAENEQADFIYTDECVFEGSPEKPVFIYYKPEFSMDMLRSYNYISHFVAFKKELLDKSGNFRTDFDCSQDYDLYFRLLENAHKVKHIPKILYYWRSHSSSTATDITLKPDILEKAKNALRDHLERCGLHGSVSDSPARGIYKVSYKLFDNPLVSIIIVGDDASLERCAQSIVNKTQYSNYEIIKIPGLATPQTYNKGVSQSKGEYIVLLGSETEVISHNWIEEMLMLNQREDIGIVGGKLYYPDKTICHAGIVLGLNGAAGCGHRNFPGDHTGYMCRLFAIQEVSAVSGACMMIKRKVFNACGGFSEKYNGSFFDIDFCLSALEYGYKVVFTPYAELYHHIDKNRMAISSFLPRKFEIKDRNVFITKWEKEIVKGDRYYNPNLTLKRDDFSFAD